MGSFFLPFSFFLYSHITSCIRDSLHFAPRFAPSKCVRCGTSSILFSPTIMKSSTCSAPWDFLLPFPFFLYSHITSCIRDSLHFVRRFAPSKCVRCGTSSILLSPTQKKASCASRRDAFFLPFPSHLIYHLTSCIHAHDHLRLASLLQMMFAAEPVRSCYRSPKRKRHVLRAVMLFFLPFPSHLIYHLTSCIRAHDHLRVALLLQMMFAAEPVRSCFRPP